MVKNLFITESCY